jgi:hypothetical protein
MLVCLPWSKIPLLWTPCLDGAVQAWYFMLRWLSACLTMWRNFTWLSNSQSASRRSKFRVCVYMFVHAPAPILRLPLLFTLSGSVMESVDEMTQYLTQHNISQLFPFLSLPQLKCIPCSEAIRLLTFPQKRNPWHERIASPRTPREKRKYS